MQSGRNYHSYKQLKTLEYINNCEDPVQSSRAVQADLFSCILKFPFLVEHISKTK